MKELKMVDHILIAAVYIIDIINEEIVKEGYINTMPIVCRQLENSGNLIKHYAKHIGVNTKAHELKYPGRDETVAMVKKLLGEVATHHEKAFYTRMVVPKDHTTLVMSQLLHDQVQQALGSEGIEYEVIPMLDHLSNWYTGHEYLRAATYCMLMTAPIEVANLSQQDKEIIDATT